MSDKLPSVRFNGGDSKFKITNVSLNGNGHGAVGSVGAQVSHNITPNTSVYTQGQVTRAQSFTGGGGASAWEAKAGLRIKF